MHELALFAGAGGGILAGKLLGWRLVGAVELEPYARAVLEQRMRDGHLDPAPVWDDVRTFLASGAAECYRGTPDLVVSAGFPCQPFSIAGKKLGGDDERNLWPETVECLRVVRPRFALLENSSALLVHSYFHTVLRDLAEAGFDAEWCVLGADDVGAPHDRKRLWIVAYPAGEGRAHLREVQEGCEQPGRDVAGRRSDRAPALDDAERGRRAQLGEPELAGLEGARGGVADGSGTGRAGAAPLADGHGAGRRELCGAESVPAEQRPAECGGLSWWGIDPADCLWLLDEAECAEPPLDRVADGMADRLVLFGPAAERGVPRVVGRLPQRPAQIRCLGNGQVPLAAAVAWLLNLTEE